MKKTTRKVISLLLAICLLSGLMAPAAAIVAPKAAGGDTLEILPVAPQKGPAGDFPAEDLLPTEPLLPEEDRLPEEEFPQEEGLKEDPSATALVAPSLSEEIPVDGMTATTGSEEPAGNHPNEGPASNALDNNEGTIWHSLWASSPMENLWIAIDLKGTYLLDGFKYLPRQGAGGSNGLITGYKIYASTDGSTWGTAVATGTWDYGSGNSDRSQKTAAFTTPVLASHVKLVATTTVSDEGKHFAAAAELRVTGTAPVYEASFDDGAHRGGWKKDGDNASGSAAIAFTDGSGDEGFATISVGSEHAYFVGADAIPQADGFVEADITPIGTTQQFALAFRYTDKDSYIGIGYDNVVKWNWCGANGNKWGGIDQKLSDQHPPEAGTKFRMRIEYVGTNVRLLIDGAELFNGVLPSGTGANSTEGLPTGAGKCGFRVWGQGNNNSIKLDNVRMGALPKTYAVNVVGGTASPSTAARGETVTVTAVTPPAGTTFDHWSSEDGVVFADANVSPTTFPMPSKAVTVTANYAYPEDTTFYVDSAAGLDTNSGTAANAPWKTLGKVNSVLLRPGSKVYLKAGSVFADQGLSLRGNGTAAKPILVDMYNGATIGTAAGAKPIINANGVPHAAFTMGNEANTGSTAYPDISYGLHIKNMSHITVKNLEITNNPTARELAVGAVVEASGNGLTSGIHLDGLNVHDVHGDTLQKTAPNGGIYFITTVANPSGTIANDHTRYDDISVQNCTVKNVSRTGISVGSSHSAHSWEGHGGGIIPANVKTNYGHTKVLIKNNFVDHVGGDAIVPQFCISPLVEHNISAYASQNTPNGGEMYNAGIWPWRCEDALFQFNEAYHTMKNGDGQAYDCDSSRGTVYQYNYSHDNGNGFMLFCQYQSVQSVVRYNVSQNDLGRIFLVSNTEKSQVYNNTIYIGAGLNTNIVENTGPMDLKNNIFYTAGTVKSPNWGNFTYDTNLYFGFTTTPNDANKITTDPKFVDPGKGGIGVEGNSAIDTLGGYALLEGSPAIGVGLLIPNNGGRDYEGNLVFNTGKPDLGAFQVATLGLTSAVYTVDQSTPVIHLNEHIAVADFLAKLTHSTGATMKAMKDNAEYTSGDVDETVTVVVTKGSETVTYAVKFAYPPAVLTSNTYTVNDTASTITIEDAVPYSTFVAGLTAAPLVTFAVKHGADTITGGTVVENDTVVVTSGNQTKTYTVKYVAIADHYNYETDFKDNTQGPIWYNEYLEGTTKLFTDWRQDWKCWVALSEKLTAGLDGDKGLISASASAPTVETYFTWVAPKIGTVELGIAYPAYLRNPNKNGNSDTSTAGFRILKNGTAISDDTLAWQNGGMLMRPLVVNVAKGDRISFATFVPATNRAGDASTHFNPTVDYVTDKEPLVETNAAKAATKTASSTAANYALNGLTDDNVSATRKSFEWKAGAVSGAWVNFAFAAPQCVTRLMLAPGKDTAIESAVKITLSDGTTQTIAKASLVSTNGYVAVPLTAPRRTSSVKLEFTTATAAVTVGDVQILTDAATTASYAALLATYNANKDKVETDYATAQWAAFAAARTAADSLLKDTAATKAQMDAAATALSGAAGSLLRVYAITLTAGTGYTLAGAPKAESGKDYSFTLTLDAPYSNAAPVVKVDGVALTKASQAGAVLTYTIPAVAAAKTVTVEPLTKNSYTVTFHVNGGNSTHEAKTISHGDAYGALPTPTTAVSNKDFDGWYTQETGGNKVTAETLVTATHTLWAHWIDQGASISPVPTISGMPATIALPHAGGIPLTVPTASTYTYLWECSKTENAWETVGTAAGYTVPEADVRVANTGWKYRCTVTNAEPEKNPTTVVGVAVTLTVTKGTQNVPTVAGDEGKITGLLAGKSYEYKLSDAADYTPVPAGSTELAGLTPGTYLVRLAGDETYFPSADATVTVLAVKYALTVQGGTVQGGAGDGRYAPGTTITIIADAPESGKVFDKWTTSDGVTFTEATAATTTFTMVANAVTVTATYKLLEYPISVMRGTANPSAAHLGQSVTITAAEPPEGKTFDKWTSTSGVIFADATAATTTFTMVAKQVAITATYRALEYTVTVAGGTTTTPTVPMGGKASATAAEPAEGMVFEKWTTSDGVHFDTVTGTTTTFTMPAKNVTVTAVYRALAYTVTVAGGTTATPQAHKGDTVTITANTPESGKMFDKWTSEDGLIFAGEATATFLMPAKNVTATAHYRELPPTPPTPPPSGGGGGSTGGGTPPIPELKPELPKTENGSTTVTTPVQSESKGSSASATVSEKTVTSAIETAVKEAERTGTVAGVVIKVDAPAASKSVELSISKSSIAAVAKGKTESLKITSPVAEISLDSKALSAVAEATDKQVKITATCIEPASLTPVQSVKVGDVPVYDFTITDGKTEVSDFRGGSATVSLPYTLKDAEEGAYVTVWYLASDGSLRPVTAQYEAGRVTFTVGHFSRYAVGYLPFNDVETGWYYESVVYVYGSKILGGVGENSFAPDARMTRAMLLTALYRMSGEKSDVQGETWYANAVAWAVEKGISDGKQLDGEVTRAQLATMVYRYYFAMQTADGDLTSGQNAALAMPQDCTFADRESIAPWARDAAAWCGANGIITGRVGNHFGPDGMATRAEVALVLLRLSEKSQG